MRFVGGTSQALHLIRSMMAGDLSAAVIFEVGGWKTEPDLGKQSDLTLEEMTQQ